MTRKEEVERRIELKKQLIKITKREIVELERKLTGCPDDDNPSSQHRS